MKIGPNRLEVLWTVITAVIFIALAVMGQSVWASLQLRQPSLGWEVQSFLCTAFGFVCWRTDQHF